MSEPSEVQGAGYNLTSPGQVRSSDPQKELLTTLLAIAAIGAVLLSIHALSYAGLSGLNSLNSAAVVITVVFLIGLSAYCFYKRNNSGPDPMLETSNEEAAATIIQKEAWRKHIVRRAEKQKAAISIQSAFRRHFAESELEALQKEAEIRAQESAPKFSRHSATVTFVDDEKGFFLDSENDVETMLKQISDEINQQHRSITIRLGGSISSKEALTYYQKAPSSANLLFSARKNLLLYITTKPLSIVDLDNGKACRTFANGIVETIKVTNEELTREEQRIAATTIQKHYRGYLTRKRVKEIKKRERAAITIQNFIRMHVAQKLYEQEKRLVLSYSLFEGAKIYTEDSVKLIGAPNAPQGANKHKIYMPQDLPVVIRVCKDEKDFSRFPKMKEALAICSKNQFRCVDVPKARLQGSFIVEERLPGENASTIKGMAFYYENREHYTEAVKEFTAFLCYGYLSDMVGGNGHIINYLGFSEVPRFDNLLLYFHEREKLYKIGICDVETFQLNSPKPTFWEVYHALSSGVQLFPYHFDVIIEVGKTFCNISEENIRELQAQSLKSMQIYKIVCEDNLSFYQKNNIALQNPTVFSLTFECKEALKKHIGAFVRNMHEHGLKGYYGRNCLNGNPDESALCFQEKCFPKMISLVEKRLNRLLSLSLKSMPPISYGELIERRMISSGMTTALQRQFEADEAESDSCALVKEIFTDEFPPIFAIFEEILNQLVKGGELSYYKAHVYCSNDLIFF